MMLPKWSITIIKIFLLLLAQGQTQQFPLDLEGLLAHRLTSAFYQYVTTSGGGRLSRSDATKVSGSIRNLISSLDLHTLSCSSLPGTKIHKWRPNPNADLSAFDIFGQKALNPGVHPAIVNDIWKRVASIKSGCEHDHDLCLTNPTLPQCLKNSLGGASRTLPKSPPSQQPTDNSSPDSSEGPFKPKLDKNGNPITPEHPSFCRLYPDQCVKKQFPIGQIPKYCKIYKNLPECKMSGKRNFVSISAPDCQMYPNIPACTPGLNPMQQLMCLRFPYLGICNPQFGNMGNMPEGQNMDYPNMMYMPNMPNNNMENVPTPPTVPPGENPFQNVAKALTKEQRLPLILSLCNQFPYLQPCQDLRLGLYCDQFPELEYCQNYKGPVLGTFPTGFPSQTTFPGQTITGNFGNFPAFASFTNGQPNPTMITEFIPTMPTTPVQTTPKSNWITIGTFPSFVPFTPGAPGGTNQPAGYALTDIPSGPGSTDKSRTPGVTDMTGGTSATGLPGSTGMSSSPGITKLPLGYALTDIPGSSRSTDQTGGSTNLPGGFTSSITDQTGLPTLTSIAGVTKLPAGYALTDVPRGSSSPGTSDITGMTGVTGVTGLPGSTDTTGPSGITNLPAGYALTDTPGRTGNTDQTGSSGGYTSGGPTGMTSEPGFSNHPAGYALTDVPGRTGSTDQTGSSGGYTSGGPTGMTSEPGFSNHPAGYALTNVPGGSPSTDTTRMTDTTGLSGVTGLPGSTDMTGSPSMSHQPAGYALTDSPGTTSETGGTTGETGMTPAGYGLTDSGNTDTTGPSSGFTDGTGQTGVSHHPAGYALTDTPGGSSGTDDTGGTTLTGQTGMTPAGYGLTDSGSTDMTGQSSGFTDVTGQTGVSKHPAGYALTDTTGGSGGTDETDGSTLTTLPGSSGMSPAGYALTDITGGSSGTDETGGSTLTTLPGETGMSPAGYALTDTPGGSDSTGMTGGSDMTDVTSPGASGITGSLGTTVEPPKTVTGASRIMKNNTPCHPGSRRPECQHMFGRKRRPCPFRGNYHPPCSRNRLRAPPMYPPGPWGQNPSYGQYRPNSPYGPGGSQFAPGYPPQQPGLYRPPSRVGNYGPGGPGGMHMYPPPQFGPGMPRPPGSARMRPPYGSIVANHYPDRFGQYGPNDGGQYGHGGSGPYGGMYRPYIPRKKGKLFSDEFGPPMSGSFEGLPIKKHPYPPGYFPGQSGSGEFDIGSIDPISDISSLELSSPFDEPGNSKEIGWMSPAQNVFRLKNRPRATGSSQGSVGSKGSVPDGSGSLEFGDKNQPDNSGSIDDYGGFGPPSGFLPGQGGLGSNGFRPRKKDLSKSRIRGKYPLGGPSGEQGAYLPMGHGSNRNQPKNSNGGKRTIETGRPQGPSQNSGPEVDASGNVGVWVGPNGIGDKPDGEQQGNKGKGSYQFITPGPDGKLRIPTHGGRGWYELWYNPGKKEKDEWIQVWNNKEKRGEWKKKK